MDYERTSTPTDWEGTPFLYDESVERIVFEDYPRILGTERVCRREWRGRDAGYTWRMITTDTAAFRTKEEAQQWRDEPFARCDLLLASQHKERLVILT